MQNELSEGLLNILTDIARNLEQVPFWKDYAFWSVVVLAITLFWLIRYTRATEKMAEYQVMPAIDVNMIYEKNVGKTYFWFSNASNIPALVLIKLQIGNTNEEHKIGPLRIPPDNPHYYQFRKTATSFDFLGEYPVDKVKAVLNVTVTPAFDDGRINFNFTKSYKFNKTESRWDETSWGYPDPPFPHTI